MQSMYYVGLDVHKKTISYCVKGAGGHVHLEGTIPATRIDLDRYRKLARPEISLSENSASRDRTGQHLRSLYPCDGCTVD
jgi:hypothetical protein